MPLPSITAFFLTLSIGLAITIGPQNHSWTWGPALMAMAFALGAAIPEIWKNPRNQLNAPTLILGCLALLWFAGRAFFSPLQNAGRDDLLLMGGVVGAFISIRAIMGNKTAEQILSWGIAALLLASLIVVAIQLKHPTFRPIFNEPTSAHGASGFFNHYNYGANFILASSVMALAFSLYGPHSIKSKLILAVIALAGIVGVYLTNSRGGLLGAVVACGAFAAALLVIGKKRNSPWFSAAAIGFPVIAVLLAIGLYLGWQHISEARSASGEAGNIFDNNARLYFLGIALSCIGMHPFIGGGSRSFSYELYRFADGKAHGDIIVANPDMVHNEWVQSLTDYGLIGSLLLTLFLGSIILTVIYRAFFENRSDDANSLDAWRLGGIAALMGILAHSCFSFVFHLIPGAILLGIALAMLTRNNNSQSAVMSHKLIACTVGCVTSLTLIFFGLKGTQATHAAWDAYLGKKSNTSSLQTKTDLYESATQHWSDYKLYERLGQTWHELAATGEPELYEERASNALIAYQNAIHLNPFIPYPPLNKAKIYSYLQEDDKASSSFERAIETQHGMEPAFRSHYHYAMHLMRKGIRHLQKNELEAGESSLQSAKDNIDAFVDKMHWVVWEDQQRVIAVHMNYGYALEANEKLEEALRQYDFVSDMEYIQIGHYQAGRVLEKRGMKYWQEREPEKAYADFEAAHLRLRQAGNALPPGVTPEQRKTDLQRLESHLSLMKKAGIISEE